MRPALRRALPVLALALVHPVASAQQTVFDLADAAVGGDGTFPGTGSAIEYPINGALAFLPQATHPFVDGVFVPRSAGVTTLSTTGLTFDFSPSVGGISQSGAVTNGGPGNGAIGINDPSGLGGNPDYTGDPNRMSLLAAHASVGITFDLDAIRAAWPWFDRFTATAGGSCHGATGYFVLVDGVVRASGIDLKSNQFHALDVPLDPSARFLTLATTDSNQGTINCAHAYFGNPHLMLTDPCYGPWVEYGAGCPGTGGFVPALTMHNNCAAAGAPLHLEVTKALGGSIALFVVGSGETATPISPSGCMLYAAGPYPAVVPIPLGGVGPGTGVVFLAAAIPLDATGLSLRLQAFVADPAEPFVGYVAANAIRLDFP